ncbi:MAG: NAD(P)H-dependent oxidoreductase [Myxococcota bacterium]|jgi:NAD(P)H-dependent FMN reductase|nr:NAD(P)H-dependent oxidoreductase [Myxococcota bacterium]
MTTLLGLAGSLRRGSYNAALLRAAIELAPEGVTIEEGTIRGIPLYDGDLEAEQGIPKSVQELKERIVVSDGLMIVTPEYNNSIPGVLKNAIDWLSRPGSDIARVFGDRPIAILGASPGRFGTAMAQAAWLPVLRALGARAWFGPRLMVGSAAQVFDADGKLVDERVRGELTKFVAGFAKSIRS